MELIDALKRWDIKGAASRLKFAWAEAALLITVACGGTGVITGQNQPAGAEGQGGQPAATEPTATSVPTLAPTETQISPTATLEATAEVISEAERLGIPIGESTWDQSAQRAAIEKYFLSKYPGKTWEDTPGVLDIALDESPARTGARRGTFSGGSGYLDPEYDGPDGNVVDAQYLGSYRSSLEGVVLGDGTVGKKGDWFVNALYAIPRNGFNTEIDGLIFENVDVMPAAVSAEVNGKFVVVMLAHGRTDSLPSSLGSLTNALKWMDDGENPNAPHLVEVSTRFVSRDKIADYISGGVLFITDSYLGNNSEGGYYPGIWDVLDQVRSDPDGVGKFGIFVIVNQTWPAGSY